MNKKRIIVISAVILTVIGALVIGLVAGRNSESDEASVSWQEQYDLGVRYLSEGNYEEAIIAFTAAIEIDPKKPDTYIGLYEAYVAVGDYESAQAAITSGRKECGNLSEFDDAQNSLDRMFSDDPEMQMYIDSEKLAETLRSGVLTYDDLPVIFSTPFNQLGGIVGLYPEDIQITTRSRSFEGIEYDDLELQECDYYYEFDNLLVLGFATATAPLTGSETLDFTIDSSNEFLNGYDVAPVSAGWKDIALGDSKDTVLSKLGLDPALSKYSCFYLEIAKDATKSGAWVGIGTDILHFIDGLPIERIVVEFGSGSADSDIEYYVEFSFIDGGPLSAIHYSNYTMYDALLNGRYESSSGEQTNAGNNSGFGNVPAPSATSEYTTSSFVGRVVQFGTYEQDNNLDNGAEPIEWLVIDENPVTGQVLLLSTRGLDCQKYHNERVSVSWSNSDIRYWLNNSFLSQAFSAADQVRIAETPTVSDGSCYDKVFFLDENEVYEYEGILEDYDYDVISPTAYAESQGAYCHERGWCWWWLRTHEADKVVDRTHDCNVIGGNVTLNFVSIRPAIWVTF